MEDLIKQATMITNRLTTTMKIPPPKAIRAITGNPNKDFFSHQGREFPP